MFDANMRYKPKDTVFIAKVKWTSARHPLRHALFSVFLCQVLVGNPENPVIRFYLPNGKHVDLSDYKSGRGSWIVFAGYPDGTGFIDAEVKAETQRMLSAMGDWQNLEAGVA